MWICVTSTLILEDNDVDGEDAYVNECCVEERKSILACIYAGE